MTYDIIRRLELEEEFEEILKEIGSIKRVRIYDVDKKNRRFRLAFEMPYGLPELYAVVDLENEDSYYDVVETPEVTPPAHLAVDEVLFFGHDYQPIMRVNPKKVEDAEFKRLYGDIKVDL